MKAREKLSYVLTAIFLLTGVVYLEAQIAIAPHEGDGSENNPYQIATLENLYWITASDEVVLDPDRGTRWASHYIQTANIDASETIEWFDRKGFIPIGGDQWNPFTGTYDGREHTIDNLYINRPSVNSIGLFGFINDGVVIENLGLNKVDINGYLRVGSLVADNQNSIIRNCYSTGMVTGMIQVGGLVGHNIGGTVSKSYNSGAVDGFRDVGGLVGHNREASISNCYNTGSVTGMIQVGGLVGFNIEDAVSKSYNTGSVTGDRMVGGLIGHNREAPISSCYSKGNVTGTRNLGGLIGNNIEGSSVNKSYSTGKVRGNSDIVGGLVGNNFSSFITNSYSISFVKGEDYVGGLVGNHEFNSIVKNSYSTSIVIGERYVGGLVGMDLDSIVSECYSIGYVTGNIRVGGLIGYSTSIISNSYYNTQTSGKTDIGKGLPRTTEQMTYPYDENTYVGWDFDEIWSADFDYLVNDGYPFFRWQYNYSPNLALNPNPVDNTKEVSVELKELRWDYNADEVHVNPVGFRVYLSDTEELNEDNDFEWVPYVEEQVEYGSSQILPGQLEYSTTYYWKVVPTTKQQGTGEGFDAQDVPVWSFRTEREASIDEELEPLKTVLRRNYPNPFNPQTVIEFNIKEDTDAKLSIYNAKGQLVKIVHNGFIEAGKHRAVWHGKDHNGREVGSGIYFYSLQTSDYVKVNKMMLMK